MPATLRFTAALLKFKSLLIGLVHYPINTKIFVGGNHDGALEHSRELITIPENVIYLENQLVECAGLKIWGRQLAHLIGAWVLCGMMSDALNYIRKFQKIVISSLIIARLWHA